MNHELQGARSRADHVCGECISPIRKASLVHDYDIENQESLLWYMTSSTIQAIVLLDYELNASPCHLICGLFPT